MMPGVSVVVPAKDAAETLPACLRALQQQSFPGSDYEIILVDDGSADRTAHIAEEAGVRVIRQETRGPAAARNSGAKAAKGDILVFTDSDCEPAEGFIEAMVRPFADPDVAAVMGAYRSRQPEPIAQFVQLEFEHKQERMARRGAINAVHTYAAAYRRRVFEAFGGFDESYPVPSNEDQEFSYRLARAGLKMVFQPQAIVFHTHDRTLGEFLQRKFRLGYWKALTLRKHPQHLRGDTHTPRSQQLQILIVLPMSLAVLAIPLVPFMGWAAAGMCALFLLSGMPFAVSAARRAPWLLWMIPGMLLARAYAQALGLAAGFLRLAFWRPLRGRDEHAVDAAVNKDD